MMIYSGLMCIQSTGHFSLDLLCIFKFGFIVATMLH